MSNPNMPPPPPPGKRPSKEKKVPEDSMTFAEKQKPEELDTAMRAYWLRHYNRLFKSGNNKETDSQVEKFLRSEMPVVVHSPSGEAPLKKKKPDAALGANHDEPSTSSGITDTNRDSLLGVNTMPSVPAAMEGSQSGKQKKMASHQNIPYRQSKLTIKNDPSTTDQSTVFPFLTKPVKIFASKVLDSSNQSSGTAAIQDQSASPKPAKVEKDDPPTGLMTLRRAAPRNVVPPSPASKAAVEVITIPDDEAKAAVEVVTISDDEEANAEDK